MSTTKIIQCNPCKGTGFNERDENTDDWGTCTPCEGIGSYSVVNVPDGTRARITGINS